MINGSTILVTGGTGSFGSTFVKKLLNEYHPKKIVIVSRDEEKQHRLRLELANSKVQFEIGDVRDRDRMFQVMKSIDLVFHAAALKQVPSCEFFPIEAAKTNVLGTENVIDAGLSRHVKRMVCLSTDKAVYPINAMGISKALMEKVAISKSRDNYMTINVTRYGNVIGSRGSVVPIWVEAAKKDEPLTVTNGDMTRFLLTLGDAVDLVLYALQHGGAGDTFIKKAPACTMLDLARAVKAMYNSKSEIQIIGTRHGEKMHESLISEEEMQRVEDCGDYYRILPDARDLNYNKFFGSGENVFKVKAYTSENTIRYDQEQVEDLLQEVL